MYSIFRVVKRIGKRRWIYLLLALQLAVGTVLMLLPLEAYGDKMAEFQAFAEQLTTQAVGILPERDGQWDFEKTVTLEDYLLDRKVYEETLDLTYLRSVEAVYLWMSETGDFAPLYVNLIFMDDSSWETLSLPQNGFGALGSSAKEALKAVGTGKEVPLGTELSSGEYTKTHTLDLTMDGETLVLNGQRFPLAPMEASVEQRSFSPSGMTEYGKWGKETICLPLEALEMLGEEELMEQGTSTWGAMTVEEKTADAAPLWTWLSELLKRHPGVYYGIDSTYMQKKLTTSQLLTDARVNLTKAVAVLILASLSSAGVMYLLFLRRRRDVAIAMMVGSTKKQQVWEVLLEAYTIIFCGMGAGLLYTLWTHGAIWFRTGVILGMTAILIGAVVASLSLMGIFSLSPVEIMTKE